MIKIITIQNHILISLFQYVCIYVCVCVIATKVLCTAELYKKYEYCKRTTFLLKQKKNGINLFSSDFYNQTVFQLHSFIDLCI